MARGRTYPDIDLCERDGMKVWQIVCCAGLGIALFVGLIISVVFYATSGITDTAEEFFAAANEGDYSKAYSLTSQQLQSQTDEAGLASFLAANSLDQVVDSSWGSRSIENDRGKLTGTVTTQSGAAIPLTVELVSEGEDWKIILIDADTSGLQSSGASADVNPNPMVLPSAAQQEALIAAASNGFVDALRDGDFSAWHTQFIEDISIGDLEQNFSGFQPIETDLRQLIANGPEWEPATTLNDNGDLELVGSYGNDSEELRFRYIFTGQGDSDPKIAFVDYEID